ncbi:hypothetical protein ACIQOW_33750 [Kitasatospora sp. NPDC091335]
MKLLIGAVLLALLVLAIATVALGAVATLRMAPPQGYDERH